MNKSLYILNRDLNVEAVMKNEGNSLSFYDDLHTENLETGAELFEFTSPADHELSEHLKVGNFIVFKNLDNNDVMFTITRVEDTHGQKFEKRVFTQNSGMELNNEYEDPYSETSQNYLPYYANKAIQWTGWELGENESESNLTLKFEEYDTVLKRLQRIASEFNMELYFTVEMQGSHVKSKKVNFVKKRGANHGKRFSYSKDITEIIRTVDSSETITAVKGIGKTDENGVTTTFKSKIYDDGDFYTQNGSDTIFSRTAIEEWGSQGGNIKGKFEYDTSNSENLFTRALNFLKENKQPKVTYEISVIALERLSKYEEEKVRIGDTVRVTDFEFNPPLLLEARVSQLETSYTDPTKDVVTLSNFKLLTSSITDEMRAIKAKLLRNEATWGQIGETIIKQNIPPSNPKEDQLWLNTDENIIYVYRNSSWIATSISASIAEDLQNQIEAVEITLNGKETYVPKSATAPSSPVEGMLWLDTSSTPNQLKVYLSGQWESATPDNTYIEDKVQEEVDKIEIGAENLFSNTAPESTVGWQINDYVSGDLIIEDEVTAPLGKALKYTVVAGESAIYKIPNIKLEVGATYTWSVYMKSDVGAGLTLGHEQNGLKFVALTTEYQQYTHTFVADNSNFFGFFFNMLDVGVGKTVWIHSLMVEKGTKPTSWRASSKEIKEDVNFLVEKTNDLEQQVSETAITTTIFNSTKYNQDLSSKANTEDIADKVSQDELNQTADQLQQNIDQKADNSRVDQAFDQISQVEQTAQDFQIKLQASGGINLLKNSVGYADFKAWTKTGTVETYVNEDFTKFGSDSVFNFVNGSISQSVLVESNNFYTLNYVIDKPTAGQLTVNVYDGGTSVASQTFADGTAYNHERFKLTFSVLSNNITVELIGTSGQVGVLMLNIGSEPLQWQQAHDEIYTSNVQVDQSGITVKSSAYNGYTVISPDEFAGYAEVIDENGNASIQRIFTLNGDTTEVKKLKAEDEISMGQIKILDVNGSKNGWAFIKNN